ncbi:MAG: phosphopentomutase [Bacteroidota bacterium]
MKNFVIILLDGVGVGELPDAKNYNDEGSNTLGNISKVVNNFKLPNLQKFGIGNIIEITGVPPAQKPLASYGKMSEKAPGKDSTSGHWEIAGIEVKTDFPYYPNGFSSEIINSFLELTDIKGILGNKAASGTEIIDELGDDHVRTGYPIVYTSADSVFQVAAHEEVIPLKTLYEICEIAREKIFINEDTIGRVIARPFLGKNGRYHRTKNRKDFSLNPPEKTILDVLKENRIETIAIGKINDLFNYKGITQNIKSKSNKEGIEKIIESLKSNSHSLIFVNLVDFDVEYGHRNNPDGFAKELQYFDQQLPRILEFIDEDDSLIITADHGNDPTTPSTDHSREYIPLLYYRKGKLGTNLGIRDTFADIAQSAADFFNVKNELSGISFLEN